MFHPYYYLNGPKEFFPEGFDLNIFKKDNVGIFEMKPEYISQKVLQWFGDIGVTHVKGLIFRKHLLHRSNLHVDPKSGGPEWVELFPKFKDKTSDYRSFVNQFAINWVYQRKGVTEWYEPLEEPDNIGTSPIDTGWFAWSSYDKVCGPISTCYHTDNPVLYNTAIPHVPVNSVDKITVSIRPDLNNNTNLTYEEVCEYLDKLGMVKQHTNI